MEMDATEIPPHLLSIYKILKSAFPGDIQREDYLSLISVLYSGFSQRNLAELLSYSFNLDYYTVLNDVYLVGSPEHRPVADAIERVKAHLIPHGYSEWLKEQGDS